MITRRTMMKLVASALPAVYLSRAFGQQSAATPPTSRSIASGPFQPTWDSLKQYKAPDWFRDAKFGIWAHWTAQCVPEQGDWYARRMYLQGDAANKFHVETYGHPSKFGFMEIDNLWKAENWDPEALMDLYVKAGREVLRRAGQPSRQLRQLRLDAPRLELRPRRAEERHRRHVGKARARARAAVRRDESLGPCVALVPDGVRLRSRR